MLDVIYKKKRRNNTNYRVSGKKVSLLIELLAPTLLTEKILVSEGFFIVCQCNKGNLAFDFVKAGPSTKRNKKSNTIRNSRLVFGLSVHHTIL